MKQLLSDVLTALSSGMSQRLEVCISSLLASFVSIFALVFR